MPIIAHRVEIEATPEVVFTALSDPLKLSEWWTQAQLSDANSSVIEFTFGEGHIVPMKVEEQVSGELVAWQCLDGPWADKGQFVFELEAIERGTNLRFTHEDWHEIDDFYRHCNSKWGFFLTVSLKGLLETGIGQPSPGDPAI